MLSIIRGVSLFFFSFPEGIEFKVTHLFRGWAGCIENLVRIIMMNYCGFVRVLCGHVLYLAFLMPIKLVCAWAGLKSYGPGYPMNCVWVLIELPYITGIGW